YRTKSVVNVQASFCYALLVFLHCPVTRKEVKTAWPLATPSPFLLFDTTPGVDIECPAGNNPIQFLFPTAEPKGFQ
ncbi:MAG: hypothetical protein AB7E73_12150, partial [Burkholderiales bacterium]